MDENQLRQDLLSIRNMMEKSSKFISLSGLSGILAGIYALIGAGIAYTIIDSRGGVLNNDASLGTNYPSDRLTSLAGIAAVVLIASLVTGILLSYRKARRKGQVFWGTTSKALLFHMAMPLITGGLLILIFIIRGYFGIIAPASLIFYGLALISASNFTFADVKYLGITEIILGLVSAVFPGFGLISWAIGFGVLHIIYGTIMYLKYDRESIL